MRHADYQGGEDERSDDHLYQAQKDVGEQRDVTGDGLRRLRIGPELVASIADGDTEQHSDEEDQGQSLRAHALPHSDRKDSMRPFCSVRKLSLLAAATPSPAAVRSA